MKKLKDIKGYVRLTLDKLPGTREDLVKLHDNWQEQDFCQLVDSLRKQTERNSKTAENSEKHFRRDNLFQLRNKDQKSAYVCYYCETPGHKSSECDLVGGTPERRSSQKRNCALILQVLNTLTAVVIKRVPIVKENITPQLVKKRQLFY